MRDYLKSPKTKITLILLLAFVTRLAGIVSRSIWYDEAFSILISEQGPSAILSGTLAMDTDSSAAEEHPPAYYFMLWGWMQVFGNSLGAIRMLSILISLGIILCIYLIASYLHGIFFPLISILLLAFVFARDLRLDPAKLGNYYDPVVFPVNAVNWLEENPQKGNMFNYFSWGGYMLYREWPDQLVFIDRQTDFYGEKLTREYEQIISISKGWEDVLKKHTIKWVIIPNNSSLAQTLESEYRWRILYEDKTAVILRK